MKRLGKMEEFALLTKCRLGLADWEIVGGLSSSRELFLTLSLLVKIIYLLKFTYYTHFF
jgi:hypothetical protein